jgi:secondary thiamine-phosphate synthase enzyme
MTRQKELTIQTSGHGDVRNLTPEVEHAVAEAGIETGIAHLSVVGSTAALGGIELEPGLAGDLPETLDRLVPPSRSYGHERAWHDGNGHSHLQSTLLGQSLSVPVSGGRPRLGTWQQLILLECDVRPRRRTVVVTVIGD